MNRKDATPEKTSAITFLSKKTLLVFWTKKQVPQKNRFSEMYPFDKY
jgi:hypothetical protein